VKYTPGWSIVVRTIVDASGEGPGFSAQKLRRKR
jgi:hypothetical protein